MNICNSREYGLSGTEPVINQECMLVHEKSGHYVKLSGTAIIDNITASNSLFEAVFLYNRKLHFLLYKKPPAGCALARIRIMSQATALGVRMCQGTFVVLKTVKILIPSTAGFRQSFFRQAQSEYYTSADLEK